MKTLEKQQMELVNGGGAISGLCAGLGLAEGGIGLAAVAVHYGWIAAIPGLGTAALVVGAGAAVTCGIAQLQSS